MTALVIPSGLWGEADAAAISAWLYPDGASVREGDVVAEIMVEKSSFDLIAPAAGILRITIPAEVPVSQGQMVGRID